MITTEIARSGDPVLKEDGRWLASSFDPFKEGQTWSESAMASLSPGEVAIIVGLGCGYHVAALKARRPNLTVLALESSREVAEKALEFNPTLSTTDIVVESDVRRLTEAVRLHDAMGGRYVPLMHAPTAQIRPEWTRDVSALLLGRDKLNFLLQLRLRPELFALLDPERIARIGNEPISIKTLQKTFRDDSGYSRERCLWRVLEELVV